MNDAECVRFLQWALPRLHMRWPGFRRVRGQVCKRLQRRIRQLQLVDLDAYRNYLLQNQDEWALLDGLCQVTISRFYRDKMVFAFLEQEVFPSLLEETQRRDEKELRIWCAGCGAGEEPYTMALLWALCLQAQFPTVRLNILGTDINPAMLQRAKAACYPFSAIKNLPPAWQNLAFETQGEDYCLQEKYRANVEFLCADLRQSLPQKHCNDGFHLICCRNLAFTYFDDALQGQVLQQFHGTLTDGGILLIGVHEALPTEQTSFSAWSERLGVYRKSPSV